VIFRTRPLGWCGAIVGVVLSAPIAAHAFTYTVRARWQPSPDATVVGYRVYTRTAGVPGRVAHDVGKPTPNPDGTLSATVPGIVPCTGNAFAVAGYRADGRETTLSNELSMAYATAAARIDSDGDGLTNAAEDRNGDCVVGPDETDPGSPDTDGDGVPDGRDRCPRSAPGAAVNTNGCSCAEVTCDDGNRCNGTETCVAGVCHAGTPLACDDRNACTTDACDPTRGCTHTPVAGCSACTTDAQCDNGRFCDGVETCQSGRCTAGTPVSCDDANACTRDVCDEAQDRCTHAAVAGCCTRDADCPRPDPCHGTPHCTAGRCTSAPPLVCPDPGPCARATCDARTGCSAVPVTDGTACDDGDPCTAHDVCQSGVCDGTVGGTSDVATSLVLRPAIGGIAVVARAAFDGADAFEMATAGVSLEIVDSGGVLLYRTTIPAALFARGSHRLLYHDAPTSGAAAAMSVKLLCTASRVYFSVRGLLTSVPADMAAGATITWHVRSGGACVHGSGHCRTSAERCR